MQQVLVKMVSFSLNAIRSAINGSVMDIEPSSHMDDLDTLGKSQAGDWQQEGKTWQASVKQEDQGLKLCDFQESAKEEQERQMSREKSTEKLQVHARSSAPGKKGTVFKGIQDDKDWIKCEVDTWANHSKNQQCYCGFDNKWDLCRF